MSPSTLPSRCVLLPGHFDGWLAAQPAAVQAWVRAQGFTGAPGTLLSIPGADGMAGAAIGVGDALDPAAYAHAPFRPAGRRLGRGRAAGRDQQAALELGWGMGGYRFNRYRKPARQPARLVGRARCRRAGRAGSRACACATGSTPRPRTWARSSWNIARELAAAHGAQVRSSPAMRCSKPTTRPSMRSAAPRTARRASSN
jgi:leucyl aminopeptidase